MNIYKISCYSRCGSYFSQYLQSVTVSADTKEDAINVVIANGYEKDFIYDKSIWDVELICENVQNNSIIDTHEDSDY